MSHDQRGFATRCIHAGQYRDLTVGGVNTPIYASSAFLHDGSADAKVGYPRYHTIPTQTAAAHKIASLENADDGVVTVSGLAAAASALLSVLDAGDRVVMQADVYGGTYHLAVTELRRLGIGVDLVQPGPDGLMVEALLGAVRPETKAVYVETPSNPLLALVDLAGVAQFCRERGLVSIVDNTFATPVNQTPLELGFDLVVHSATKYLNGHSDLCCGAVVGAGERIARVRERVINFGQALPVLDASLLERGLKTLALRMSAHNRNGLAVAEYLESHPRVRRVNYPGLASHRQHALARDQMRGFGGMVSVELDCAPERVGHLMQGLEVFTPAISLGGVESLISSPAVTSHAKLSAEQRAQLGVTDTLLRLSVGVEDLDDLIDDLERALARV